MGLVLCIRPAALPGPAPAFKGKQTALVSQAVGPGSWRQWTDPRSSGRKWPWAPSDPVNLLFQTSCVFISISWKELQRWALLTPVVPSQHPNAVMAFLFPNTCVHGHLREDGMKVLGQPNKHQLGGLKQQKWVISALRRSGVHL